MLDAAHYLAEGRMRDGRTFKIRAVRRDDEADIMAAVARASPQSLYRRFFGPKRHFTEQEIEYFMTVDFVKHVCLVTTVEEAGRSAIVGGVRYIVHAPGKAEVSFAVIDEYQAKGIGGVLMQHIAEIARKGGVRELTADVMPDNAPMLRVFQGSGLPIEIVRDPDGVHVVLKLS